MIQISWDETSKKWFQHSAEEEMVWGAVNKPLPYSPVKTEGLNLSLRRTETNKAGPIVGILTSSARNLPFIGNLETFKRLSNYVHHNGGLTVIFSAKDVFSTTIVGYTLDSERMNWRQVVIPLPDFIYNRIPYPADEHAYEFDCLFNWFETCSIPYFNRCFFSKWDTYLILNDNPALHSYLPETRLIHSKRQLNDFIYEYKHIIIKPISSSKGKGIFTIKLNQNDSLLYQSNEGSIYSDLDQLWHVIQEKKNTLIMQPFVCRKKYHSRPYDYRVLVQKQGALWNVTGYGLRCAGVQQLTTHIPSGGRLLPVAIAPLDIEIINEVATEIGKSLDQAMGPVGEFSIDLGIDTSGGYWIFEVNSKPMVFDEKEIESESLSCWYSQILELTGFSPININQLLLTNTNEKGG